MVEIRQGLQARTSVQGGNEQWALRRGAQATLRQAGADDEAAVRELVEGLSRDSRYFRFLTGGRVADSIIEGLVRPGAEGAALVVTVPTVDGGAEVVANGQFVVTDRDTAEFAVVVADDWQGQGLGRRLITKLQQLAQAAGVRRLRGDVLSENRRMLAILRGLGFSCRRNPEDSFLHEATLAFGAADADATASLPAGWFSAR
ncbi:GNAT family N-acetyltransferase [Cupriavidus pinatubonensis]|uniref:GNAT family N-acetyltransferase n=1 Tax=Cupriavidus pinatubonensis TaxID=248026 RepID=UPI00112D09C2|nr:GNAT family N-acetyltransferase [Cupriavidus pinatubonensis]TPQ35178.1 GNAT family N-acetyltransferase [Cupriavidus pinatubonensis]